MKFLAIVSIAVMAMTSSSLAAPAAEPVAVPVAVPVAAPGLAVPSYMLRL